MTAHRPTPAVRYEDHGARNDERHQDVQDQIAKYTQKLLRDRTAAPGSIRLYRLDDVVIPGTRDECLPVFSSVLQGLDITDGKTADAEYRYREEDFRLARERMRI